MINPCELTMMENISDNASQSSLDHYKNDLINSLQTGFVDQEQRDKILEDQKRREE